MKKLHRRQFIQRAAAGSAVMAGLPLINTSCATPNPEGSDYFQKGNTILFQGDSITDAGRDKKKGLANDPRSFGGGYALYIAARLLRDHADKNLTIYNRGISGNKVYQLADRWQTDCFDLNPNILSILIGVNDYWHMRNGNYDGTPEIYENDFRKLLENTKDKFPEIELVICEPFILTDTQAVDESWVEPFSHYQKIAKKISDEFGTTWVPFQKVFTNALAEAPAVYWTHDGVHPSMAGAQLMADAWLKAVYG